MAMAERMQAERGGDAALEAVERESLEQVPLRLHHPETKNLVAELLSAPPVRAALGELTAHDAESGKHSYRVGLLTADISFDYLKRGAYSERLVRIGTLAALLHDLGKCDVAEGLLQKASGLTDAEFEAIKQHPRSTFEHLGQEQFRGIPDIELIREIAVEHHEWKWDEAKRYPREGFDRRKPGRFAADRRSYPEEVDELTQVLVAADVFDALVSPGRNYNAGLTKTEPLIRTIMNDSLIIAPEFTKAALARFPDRNAAHLQYSIAA